MTERMTEVGLEVAQVPLGNSLHPSEMFDTSKAIASSIFLAHQRVIMTFALLTTRDLNTGAPINAVVIASPAGEFSANTKPYIYGAVKQLAETTNAIAVGTVSEMWMSFTKLDGRSVDLREIVPPSKSPDRIEALGVTMQTRRKAFSAYARIQRADTGKATLGEWASMSETGTTGDLFDLLPNGRDEPN